VPGLAAHEARLDLRLPRPIPRPLLERALGFFRAVFQRWEGEAVLVMLYAPPTETCPVRYRFVAPPQKIHGRVEGGRFRAFMRLDYGACARPAPEFRKLGTIHSHGDLPARHSAIDEHDELFETGLHVTAGYIHTTLPEFQAAFVVGGARFPVAAADVLAVRAAPTGRPASM